MTQPAVKKHVRTIAFPTIPEDILVLLLIYCAVPENIHTRHGRDFSYDPPSPLNFPKSAHTVDPPSGNSIFVAHPLEILSFLVETKNKLFFTQNTEF